MKSPSRRHPRADARARLDLNPLEPREVPASFVVTTLQDEADPSDGQVSLREAIAGVNASTDASNTITFASGLTGTINLLSGAAGSDLTISKAVTITGPGANVLTVNGSAVASSRVFNVAPAAGTAVSISGLTVTGGTGVGSGTGLFSGTGASLTLSGVAISDNRGAGDGALTSTSGSLTLGNSTISGNSSTGGNGGVVVLGGMATFDQDTIYGNRSINGVGGVAFGNAVTATLRNCTVAGNSSANFFGTGGVAVAGNVTFSSTIVANNSADGTPTDVTGGPQVTSDHNLIGSPYGLLANTIIDGVNGNQLGSLGQFIDPKLGPLAYNGGPTETLMPAAGSPAIGRGSANGFTTDQRGFIRTVGAGIDIGAVEAGASAGTTSSAGTGSGSGTAAGTGSGAGSGTGSGGDSGFGTPDPRRVINQLVIANFRNIFAQPLPPQVALAMITKVADVNGDGFPDITCLIGLRVGSGRNTRTQFFKIVFDGLSPDGATIGGVELLFTV